MSSHLLAFTGVVVLITLVPGIDTALVTRNVVAGGRRGGIITALGTSTGLCIHVVAVALGVSVILLRRWPSRSPGSVSTPPSSGTSPRSCGERPSAGGRTALWASSLSASVFA
jgi:hypothetical protein